MKKIINSLKKINIPLSRKQLKRKITKDMKQEEMGADSKRITREVVFAMADKNGDHSFTWNQYRNVELHSMVVEKFVLGMEIGENVRLSGFTLETVQKLIDEYLLNFKRDN